MSMNARGSSGSVGQAGLRLERQAHRADGGQAAVRAPHGPHRRIVVDARDLRGEDARLEAGAVEQVVLEQLALAGRSGPPRRRPAAAGRCAGCSRASTSRSCSACVSGCRAERRDVAARAEARRAAARMAHLAACRDRSRWHRRRRGAGFDETRRDRARGSADLSVRGRAPFVHAGTLNPESPRREPRDPLPRHRQHFLRSSSHELVRSHFDLRQVSVGRAT